MYEGVRQYADSFEADEYGELRDEAELEFETGRFEDRYTPPVTRRAPVRLCAKPIAP